jgi:ribosomal protein L3
MRPGIIAKKIGMSNFYTPNGLNIPVTILHVDDCKVIERTAKPELESDKVLLGACEIKKEKKKLIKLLKVSLKRNLHLLLNILESLQLIKMLR